MMPMSMNYLALVPEAVLLAAAVTVLLAGSFLPGRRRGVVRWLTLGALVVSPAAALAASGGPDDPIFTGTYVVDASTTLARVLAPLCTAVVVMIGRQEFLGAARESESYTLLLLATLGTVVMGGGTDLLVLIAAFLLSSIPLYALIGIRRSPRAAEATLKTYLMGALFGVLLLAGAALLTALAGTSSYVSMQSALAAAPTSAVIIGAVAVITGLLFKAGAVPGHFWVPDATEAAGTAVGAFVTTVPKIGALVAIIRLVGALPSTFDVPLLVAVLAALSMTVGNLAALLQHDVRRLLGWSTVSQVGYLLMPVAVVGGAAAAPTSLLAYLVLYSVSNLTLFGALAALPGRGRIEDFAGTARQHPWLTATIVVGALSLVGTPPTAVFFGKLAVFAATWDGGLVWLVVVAAVNTVVSLFYYLRLFTAPFRAIPEGAARTALPTAHPTVQATALLLAATVLLAGFASVMLAPQLL
ncbi:proton-conducting transporter membrane subunit [Agrococcus sp. ProA11]|uniref:NADH-quinone oxidoreductase subunit N n=1 Tax=Agrococcus chionoecetis TaxID=3153752 RepID=UPI0032613D5E